MKYWPYYAALAFALLMNATANLLMKVGAKDAMRSIKGGDLLSQGVVTAVLRVAGSPLLMLGIVLFAANVLAYIYALQRIPISVAYPIMVSTGFLIIVAVSGVLLGERLNMLQWIGSLLILLGVVLVASQIKPEV